MGFDGKWQIEDVPLLLKLKLIREDMIKEGRMDDRDKRMHLLTLLHLFDLDSEKFSDCDPDTFPFTRVGEMMAATR